MVRKKETKNPIHHVGKCTEYELVDGVYYIAPIYITRFRDLAARQTGIDEMLGSVTRHATGTLEQIAKEYQHIWSDIINDIGLDKSIQWIYTNGIIKPKEQTK